MYTEKNYNRNTFVFAPIFAPVDHRSKTFALYMKGLFLSNCNYVENEEESTYSFLLESSNRQRSTPANRAMENRQRTNQITGTGWGRR